MVIKSVLPNLLNVAQIVSIFSNASNALPLAAFYADAPHLLQQQDRQQQQKKQLVAWPDVCTPETVAVHSQRVINLIFNKQYDKHLTPDPNGVTVSIELALQTFYDISENSASFTADILMSQIWHDRRLSYSRYTSCLENLTFSSSITDKIWQPYVCFVNSKKSELHTSPSPNTFVLIYPNGTVWVNYRLRIEGPCYVDLALYPFNEEECELILESYAYNAANVRLKWRDWSPVLQYPSRTKLPDFVLSEIRWAKHQFMYAAGQWDQLTVSFFLTRQFGVYIVQMYFPVETAVAMSWIPFYLDHRSLPARITLGVSALMSITFQYGNILKNLPRVSYIMSVDVWIFAAVVFVFGSLVELAIVGHLHRRAASATSTAGSESRGSTDGMFLAAGSRRSRFKSSAKCRRFDKMTWDSNCGSPDGGTVINTGHYYGTFLEENSDMEAPQTANGSGGSCLQIERGTESLLLDAASVRRSTSQRPSVMFDTLSRFSRSSLDAAADRKRRRQKSITNYAVFQAQFVYKKIRDKWSDPLYWDETSRIYFPLSFFVFNLMYWFYYLGYRKLLKPWWGGDTALRMENASTV